MWIHGGWFVLLAALYLVMATLQSLEASHSKIWAVFKTRVDILFQWLVNIRSHTAVWPSHLRYKSPILQSVNQGVGHLQSVTFPKSSPLQSLQCPKIGIYPMVWSFDSTLDDGVPFVQTQNLHPNKTFTHHPQWACTNKGNNLISSIKKTHSIPYFWWTSPPCRDVWTHVKLGNCRLLLLIPPSFFNDPLQTVWSELNLGPKVLFWNQRMNFHFRLCKKFMGWG